MAGKQAAATYRNGDVWLGWRGETAVACFTDEGTGKRKRVGLGRLSEAEARAALDRFAEARRAIARQQQRHTIGQLWDLWLADRAEDGFSNAIYRANWAALGPAFGSRDPALLSIADSRAYARARFAAGRAPATVATELVRLRHCLKWAAKRRLIEWAPDVWVPARGGPRDRTLTVGEAKRLMQAARDPHVELFIVLAIATGARHTAILDLTWARVDFERGLIQYDETLPPDPMNRSWRKGRATVPMSALTRAALERAYAGRRTDYVIEHGGRRLKSIREGFANAVARAGLSEVTPHTLRHSVSTWLKERDVKLERRAQLLGHADIRTTDMHYSHADAAVYLSGVVEILDKELMARSGESSADPHTGHPVQPGQNDGHAPDGSQQAIKPVKP